jgi:hypothetical protein
LPLEYSKLTSVDDALLRNDGSFIVVVASVLHRPPTAVSGGKQAAVLCLRHRCQDKARRPASRRRCQKDHREDDDGGERLRGRRAVGSAAMLVATVGAGPRRDAGAERLGPVGVDEVRGSARAEVGEPGAAEIGVVPVLESALQLRQFWGTTKPN